MKKARSRGPFVRSVRPLERDIDRYSVGVGANANVLTSRDLSTDVVGPDGKTGGRSGCESRAKSATVTPSRGVGTSRVGNR